MLSAEDIQPERVRPLLRIEYEHLVESGAFDQERIELLEGVLVTMSPQDARHAYVIEQLADALAVPLHGRAFVRIQLPLAVSNHSEPEPDLAVVPRGDHSTGHPTTAHLVVEVADSSLRRDRLVKARVYAGAAIPEYWIIDTKSRTVEVRRDPDAAAGSYRSVTVVHDGEVLRLLAFPDVEIAIASILPPARPALR